jgi:hypothetical protein
MRSWRCFWIEFIMPLVKISTPKINLPPIVKIGKKTFKVK